MVRAVWGRVSECCLAVLGSCSGSPHTWVFTACMAGQLMVPHTSRRYLDFLPGIKFIFLALCRNGCWRGRQDEQAVLLGLQAWLKGNESLSKERFLGTLEGRFSCLQLAAGSRTALALTSGMSSSRNFLTQHQIMLDSKSCLALGASIAPVLQECLGARLINVCKNTFIPRDG